MPIYVWGDEFKAEEVFTNYLSNAITHCSGEKKINVIIQKKDDRIRVSVFNKGELIPEESIEHLFEKFYKIDKARTREYGGSGIGLSIVSAIAESLGATRGVSNDEGGVTFFITFDK
jgi:signal transduction histidine kinase